MAVDNVDHVRFKVLIVFLPVRSFLIGFGQILLFVEDLIIAGGIGSSLVIVGHIGHFLRLSFWFRLILVFLMKVICGQFVCCWSFIVNVIKMNGTWSFLITFDLVLVLFGRFYLRLVVHGSISSELLEFSRFWLSYQF